MVPFAASSPRRYVPGAPPGGQGWRGRSPGERLALGSSRPRIRLEGRQDPARRPSRFEEKRAWVGGVQGDPKRGREGPRAAKLDARSSGRSAVAAEMFPTPPPRLPPPPPPCPLPPIGKLTRAARGRNPRLCQAPREEHEGGGSEQGGRARQTGRLGAGPGGSERGSERGRYRRPPTETLGAVAGPPAPSPGRSSQTIVGWGKAGRGGSGALGMPATPSCQLGPKGRPSPGGAVPGRTFPLIAGAARGVEAGVPPPMCSSYHSQRWDSRAPAGLLPQTRGSLAWLLRAKAAVSQLPRVFLCLPAGAW